MHGHRTLKKSHIFVSSSRPIFTYTYRLHLISLYPCIPYFPSIHFSIIIFLSFSSSLTFPQSRFLSFQSPFLSQSLLLIFLSLSFPFFLLSFSFPFFLLSFSFPFFILCPRWHHMRSDARMPILNSCGILQLTQITSHVGKNPSR